MTEFNQAPIAVDDFVDVPEGGRVVSVVVRGEGDLEPVTVTKQADRKPAASVPAKGRSRHKKA